MSPRGPVIGAIIAGKRRPFSAGRSLSKNGHSACPSSTGEPCCDSPVEQELRHNPRCSAACEQRLDVGQPLAGALAGWLRRGRRLGAGAPLRKASISRIAVALSQPLSLRSRLKPLPPPHCRQW